MYYIALATIVPYICFLVAFFLINRKRKRTKDFYMNSCLVYYVCALVIRIACCSAIIMLYQFREDDKIFYKDHSIMEVKMSAITMQVPYYCFLMFTLALIFSAMEFIKSMK